METAAHLVDLKPHTVEAFDAYVRTAEAAMEQTEDGIRPFLWSDLIGERAPQACRGHLVAQFWSGRGPQTSPRVAAAHPRRYPPGGRGTDRWGNCLRGPLRIRVKCFSAAPERDVAGPDAAVRPRKTRRFPTKWRLSVCKGNQIACRRSSACVIFELCPGRRETSGSLFV